MEMEHDSDCSRDPFSFSDESYGTGDVLVAWSETTMRNNRYTSDDRLRDFRDVPEDTLVFVITSFEKQRHVSGGSFWTELFVVTSIGSGWMSNVYLERAA